MNNDVRKAQIRATQQLLEERIGEGIEGFLCRDADPWDPLGPWHVLQIPEESRTRHPFWNLVIRDTTIGNVTLETKESIATNPIAPSGDWDNPAAATKYSP